MSRASRLAELRALRASGKTRLSTYVAEEAESLYDEVDEEGYKKVVRSRLDRDDFIVDDHGEGYADDGREEWDNERRYSSGSEDDASAPIKATQGKRKRGSDPEREQKITNGINKYFSASSAAPAPQARREFTSADTSFIDDLLGEMDVNVAGRRPAVPTKTVKLDQRRKTRVLSPPIMEAKQVPKLDVAAASLGTPPHEADDTAVTPVPMSIDDDLSISDGSHLPSSPVVQAVDRKTQVVVKVEEDEDMMEVAQAIGHSGVSSSVNMSGSRPIVKKVSVKAEYPTPENSSPTKPPAENMDPSAWNDISTKLNIIKTAGSDVANVGKLSPNDALEEDGSLRFFWFDYTEMNGSLLLFGKVKNKKSDSFVSCFVKVDNILRKLYFLPREFRRRKGQDTDEEVEMQDVYEEVDSLMSRHKVNMHKIKPCTRKYAFEMPNIPKEAEYLKLLYPYDKPPLDIGLAGDTFSHVFGTNTSLFEQFVLWKNIMGPCWLTIQDADFEAVNNASWCKLELQVSRPNSINALEETENQDAPPMTLMSIAMRTKMNIEENKQEILLVSARIYENVSLTDTAPAEKLPCKTLTIMRPVTDSYPTGFKLDAEKHVGNVKLEKSEQALLSLFLAQLQRIDPDVLIGHRLEDLDYSTLLNRLRDRKTPGWHRIGRLRRNEWPKQMGKGGANFFQERQLVAGRLLCDLANDQGKSLMTKCQSWTLSEMCELVLAEGNIRRDIDNEVALKTWANTRQGLMNYMKHCEADTYFIAAIAIKIQMLPLTKVLTNLAGNSWARTLTGTRAERNEYILLHEFHRNKYICPDKIWGKSKQKVEEEPLDGEENPDAKKKDKYKGGLVFEPEKGLYDKVVLVMDFNSLYPSIIQEYNICFTTVERANFTEEDDNVPEIPEDQELGILPRLIRTLVERRRAVKKLMKSKTATADDLSTWDIKQFALKLTANSMYGCLGYTRSRFYCRPLAMLTTFKGREILRSTKELAETRQLQVIYGDTDSVMINTNTDNIQEALRVGSEFKNAVNNQYKLLEIDIDNTFRRLLLHAKKKYAAINMVEVDGKFVDKLEVKGLDMRRREYCSLSKETSSNLLNMLLSGEEPELVVNKIHEYLRELSSKMRDSQIHAGKYTIFTQLSKDPRDYPNAKSMPSVQVALRLQARGKPVRAKDVMAFIITGDNHGSSESAASNAYPPDEVLKAGSGLSPDIDYYLHKQILPPVERLCAPITLTNVTRLADCLGLDTSKYRVTNGATAGNRGGFQEDTVQRLDSQIPDSVRFADCAPIVFRCLDTSCASPTFSFRSIDLDAHVVSHAGLTCPSCNTGMSNLTVIAQLEAQIRSMLSRYYEAWVVCDDPSCGNRTRQISVYGHRCLGPKGLGTGCLGKMGWELSEKAVWNQLMFWERAWDVERAKNKVARGGNGSDGIVKEEEGLHEKVVVLSEVNRERFETCRAVVKAHLDKSGRQWVDMGSLFAFAR